MKRILSRAIDFAFILVLSLLLATPQDIFAQDHVISSSDIQRDLAAASASRQRNLAQLEGFLSSPKAQQALNSAHISYRQVKNAVRQLSDEDLARLSARTEKAQKDFAAGTLSDRDLIIILIAVVGLILIIVAVR